MPHRWCNAAELRKKQIETGLDITFNKIFLPCFADIFKTRKPNAALEIGSGTGHLANHLGQYAALYHAIEPSEGMFAVSKNTINRSNVRMFNCKLEEFKNSNQYDLIFSHLVAQTIENLKEFFNKTSTLLNANGTFVFSIPHPCFWNFYKEFFDEKSFNYMVEQGKEITLKISLDSTNPITDVPFFHRPLSSYVKHLSSSNFFIDDIEEIYPTEEIQRLYPAPWQYPRYLLLFAKKRA